MISADARGLPWPRRLTAVSKQAVYTCQLLLDRRLWLYLAGDAFFLFAGLLEAIESMGKQDLLEQIYPWVVVMPMLVLGLPAMSGVVALERRAGSLDLALAVPSTEGYFLRRIAPVCALMVVQGWIVLLLTAEGWTLVRALYQCMATAALLAALVLFWAVRLKTSGAVLVASIMTIALLSPWIFYHPTRSTLGLATDFMGISLLVLAWCWKAAVQTLTAVILLLYARQRLRRPESMLA